MARTTSDLIELLDLEEIERDHYRGVSPTKGGSGSMAGRSSARRWWRPGGRSRPIGMRIRCTATSCGQATPASRSCTWSIASATDAVSRPGGWSRFSAARRSSACRSRFRSTRMDSSIRPTCPRRRRLRRWRTRSPCVAATLTDCPKRCARLSPRDRLIDLRPVEPVDIFNPPKRDPEQLCWMKCPGELPDDRRLHQCVLAYLSDWSLLDTTLRPHAISFTQPNVQVASLDHAMWFHRPFRADEWLLYAQDSPSASGARGSTAA